MKPFDYESFYTEYAVCSGVVKMTDDLYDVLKYEVPYAYNLSILDMDKFRQHPELSQRHLQVLPYIEHLYRNDAVSKTDINGCLYVHVNHIKLLAYLYPLGITYRSAIYNILKPVYSAENPLLLSTTVYRLGSTWNYYYLTDAYYDMVV